MSADRDKKSGEVRFVCDDCDDVLDTGEEGFLAARERLKAERWTTRQVDGEWTHRCPDCKPPAPTARGHWYED